MEPSTASGLAPNRPEAGAGTEGRDGALATSVCMSDILFHYYRVNPTTWFYLSSLLSIALFFKFNRVWSVRNLDLIGLILLAPAMRLVQSKRPTT